MLSFFRSSVVNHFNFIESDGQGYYIYLPCLLINGNLDYATQIKDHPWFTMDFLQDQNRDNAGRFLNKYPIGFALSLSPPFISAHLISKLLFALTGFELFSPDGYTPIYQLFCLLFIMGLGLTTLLLCHWLLTQYFQISHTVAATAGITYWVGSHYAYYFFREPFTVHLVSTFWVTLSFVAIGIMVTQMRNRSWGWGIFLVAVLATSMALICRLSNIFLAPFWVWWIFEVYSSGLWKEALLRLPLGSLGLAPLALQALVWKYTRGHFLYLSYGGGEISFLKNLLWPGRISLAGPGTLANTAVTTAWIIFVDSPVASLGDRGGVAFQERTGKN